jgi:hypothetical protein
MNCNLIFISYFSFQIVVTHVDELKSSSVIDPVVPRTGVRFGSPNGNFVGPTVYEGGSNGLQENFGPAPDIKNLAQPTDFFNEFFPSTRPNKNHPKRIAPEIETPKEFLQFVG